MSSGDDGEGVDDGSINRWIRASIAALSCGGDGTDGAVGWHSDAVAVSVWLANSCCNRWWWPNGQCDWRQRWLCV